MLNHAVGIFSPRGEAGLVTVLRSHVGPEMHARGIVPAEERRIGANLPLHEVDGGRRRLVVDRFHALPAERAGVLDSLFADAAPTRLLVWVVAVRSLAA